MELKYLIGIGGYLALMLFIGHWVKNKISTAEDYLVGGRYERIYDKWIKSSEWFSQTQQ